MIYGYHGNVLHVDLTNRLVEVEHPDETFYRKYLGGSALGLHYLLSNTGPGIDPFAPENTLVLALSVITGAPISGQSRMTAVAKSPLTEVVGDSQCGGFFPAAMKFSGFDAVVLKGRADRPVYLWLHDGEAELRPADHLWGKITGEVEAILREELGEEKIEILQIGIAGENLVRFAAMMNMSNRANGRTGMGAVMGSKNLKAVAVYGKNTPDLFDRQALVKLSRWGAKHFEESDLYGLGLLGTASVTRSQNAAGGQVTRNWASGFFENAEALDGSVMAKTILKDRDTCYACLVRCKRVVEVTEGPYKVDPHYGGPEYETLSTFGTYCGIDDLDAVAHANQLCNMYGMDTISCGATIAWAMDCFEKGIITAKDTEGIELRFGNVEAMVQMTRMIALREGFGALLAEGSARAAAQLGRGSEDLVVAVKKQELPGYMPQVNRSLALIYATNSFGPDHESHEHDPSYLYYPERMAELGLTNPQPIDVLNEEKVRYALTTQKWYSCLDSLCVCNFVFGPAWQLYRTSQLAEAVSAITGWDINLDELMLVGERRLNLLRSFNAREGVGREADVLPKKLKHALVGGKTDGIFITDKDVEQAKDWYYALAGWDVASGTPTRAKLAELNLEWVADEIGI